MPEHDAWDLVRDALDCKTPARVPCMCIALDFEFLERLHHGAWRFTYDEFKDTVGKGLSWLPFFIPGIIKLGMDASWMTTSVTKLLWLDEHGEPAMANSGRFKVTTRETAFEPEDGMPKRPIPHAWNVGPCFSGSTPREVIERAIEKQPAVSTKGFKNYRKMREACERHFNHIVFGGVPGMWEPISLGFGLPTVSKLWRKDKEFLHQIRDFFHEIGIRTMEGLLKHGKPKVVMIGDDYGYNEGLIMGTIEMWRDLVKPTLVEYAHLAHDADVKLVLHSCGRIESLFNDFAEIGLDGVQSLQPNLNDLPAIKRKHGNQIAMLGTLDDTDMMKNATPDEIRAYTRDAITRLGPAGFVPGPTNALMDHPVENVVAMVDEIKNFKTATHH